MLKVLFKCTSALAAMAAIATPALAQSLPNYGRVGNWEISQTSSEAVDGGLSCAAVLMAPGGNDAMRIERTEEGYWFGINGFDRATFAGDEGFYYPMEYSFDGDAATRAGDGLQARFIRDANYPDDDWLSHFAADGSDDPFFAILGTRNVTFEVENPGNRTGNDTVGVTFPTGDVEWVLRGLDECYTQGQFYAAQTEGPIPACRDDGLRLPQSGICEGQAVAYLRVSNDAEPELPEGCEWRVNEGWIADNLLLYLAAHCGGKTARLNGAVGSGRADLMVVESALSQASEDEPFEPYEFAHVYARTKDTPEADVLHRALFGRQREVSKTCKVYPADGVTDGYLVDVSEAERARQPQDEAPEHLCGEYGAGDDADVWRVFQGQAWFLWLGQDGYHDVDHRSLTLLSREGSDEWGVIPD